MHGPHPGAYAEQSGSISGTYLPMMALHQSVILHWKEDQEVEAHSLRYTAALPDIPGIMWPELSAHLGPADVRGHGDVYMRLLLPFDRALAQRIEDWRQGRSLAVRIEIRGNVVFRRIKKFVVPDGPKKEASPGQIAWQPERHLLMPSPLDEDGAFLRLLSDAESLGYVPVPALQRLKSHGELMEEKLERVARENEELRGAVRLFGRKKQRWAERRARQEPKSK